MPAEWSASLKALQDDLPACPPSYLRRTVREELGQSVGALFAELDEGPIASASVAQVHVGRLWPGASSTDRATGSGTDGRAADDGREGDGGGDSAVGAKVVLKLQHRGIEPLMRRDMVACIRMTRFARWLNPDMAPMHMVLDAWQHEMYVPRDPSHAPRDPPAL